jgi:hypothetical protein
MKGRRGIGLVESLVVLLLSLLVIQVGWSAFGVLRRAAGGAADLSEGLETVRTVAWILEEELSGGLPGRDWWAGGGDTLALRAYRGLGVVRGVGPGGEARVCYGGLRVPNPEKDSVLLLSPGGAWMPHALLARDRGAPGCLGTGEWWEETWTLDPEPTGALLARVFERGSYHLTQGALRYRRGAGGRQPLTPLRIGEGRLQEEALPDFGLRWAVRLSRPGGGLDTLTWSGWAR